MEYSLPYLTMSVWSLLLAGSVFWIWMFIDCALQEPAGAKRNVWMIVIFLTHVLGALAYALFRRPLRIAEKHHSMQR